MALPPRGDPRRPLRLAVRSMRALGTVMCLFGAVTLVAVAVLFARMPIGVWSWRTLIAIVAGGMIYVAPGVLYLILSVALTRRKWWAVTVGLVLAGLHAALMVIGVALGTVSTVRSGDTAGIVVLAIAWLVLAALAQLLFHLSRSYEAIRVDAHDQYRGFALDPVTPVPVIPVTPIAPTTLADNSSSGPS